MPHTSTSHGLIDYLYMAVTEKSHHSPYRSLEVADIPLHPDRLATLDPAKPTLYVMRGTTWFTTKEKARKPEGFALVLKESQGVTQRAVVIGEFSLPIFDYFAGEPSAERTAQETALSAVPSTVINRPDVHIAHLRKLIDPTSSDELFAVTSRGHNTTTRLNANVVFFDPNDIRYPSDDPYLLLNDPDDINARYAVNGTNSIIQLPKNASRALLEIQASRESGISPIDLATKLWPELSQDDLEKRAGNALRVTVFKGNTDIADRGPLMTKTKPNDPLGERYTIARPQRVTTPEELDGHEPTFATRVLISQPVKAAKETQTVTSFDSQSPLDLGELVGIFPTEVPDTDDHSFTIRFTREDTIPQPTDDAEYKKAQEFSSVPLHGSLDPVATEEEVVFDTRVVEKGCVPEHDPNLPTFVVHIGSAKTVITTTKDGERKSVTYVDPRTKKAIEYILKHAKQPIRSDDVRRLVSDNTESDERLNVGVLRAKFADRLGVDREDLFEMTGRGPNAQFSLRANVTFVQADQVKELRNKDFFDTHIPLAGDIAIAYDKPQVKIEISDYAPTGEVVPNLPNLYVYEDEDQTIVRRLVDGELHEARYVRGFAKAIIDYIVAHPREVITVQMIAEMLPDVQRVGTTYARERARFESTLGYEHGELYRRNGDSSYTLQANIFKAGPDTFDVTHTEIIQPPTDVEEVMEFFDNEDPHDLGTLVGMFPPEQANPDCTFDTIFVYPDPSQRQKNKDKYPRLSDYDFVPLSGPVFIPEDPSRNYDILALPRYDFAKIDNETTFTDNISGVTITEADTPLVGKTFVEKPIPDDERPLEEIPGKTVTYVTSDGTPFVVYNDETAVLDLFMGDQPQKVATSRIGAQLGVKETELRPYIDAALRAIKRTPWKLEYTFGRNGTGYEVTTSDGELVSFTRRTKEEAPTQKRAKATKQTVEQTTPALDTSEQAPSRPIEQLDSEIQDRLLATIIENGADLTSFAALRDIAWTEKVGQPLESDDIMALVLAVFRGRYTINDTDRSITSMYQDETRKTLLGYTFT